MVSSGDTHVLVDAGLSAAQLRSRLEQRGLMVDQLAAILLTHEHQDHCRGLDVLLRKHAVPIYATRLTREALREQVKSAISWKLFTPGQRFSIGCLEIDAFPIPHDAVEPMGFVLHGQMGRLGVLTDAGHVTTAIRNVLHGVDSLYVEANYDDDMLEADQKRPWSTKQRISGQHGHLSNKQASRLLSEILAGGLERAVLGHLSRDCNTPDAARAEALRGILAGQLDVHCSQQDCCTDWLPVRTKPLPPAEKIAPAMLKLASGFVQLKFDF